MNTLQIHDVFEPYYAGRNRFFDHSAQPGKEQEQRRQAGEVAERKQPEQQTGPDRCAA
jgi:hypothetical protein